jgi:hypothetical protein
MTAIPILSGIVASGVDFTTSFPVNMILVPKTTGISAGFLRPAEGIIEIADAGGANRGGTRWRNEHYRVMGSSFIKVSAAGVITTIGAIDGVNFCTFAESFDYLAINGGGKVYLYNGTTLTQITDVDLGVSLDVEWINGYFLSTDGAFIASSDITDPFAWNPLRYSSSEASPDPIIALQKVKNELYALNRYTIEVFGTIQNPGLEFPFGRIEGAQIMKGCIGSRACCVFMQSLGFLGSGDNESPAVWIAVPGSATKISTRDIDDVLKTYTDAQLSGAVLEARLDRGHEWLYVHLPDQTLVFDGPGSQAVGQPVWFVLRSGVAPVGGYRARGMVWCYDRWNVADSFGTKIGYMTNEVGSHYGVRTVWSFTTPIVYNEGKGTQLHELELVAITGSVAFENDPLIAAEYTEDGKSWSQPRYIRAGRRGERNKRLTWSRQGTFNNWRAYRFSGDDRALLAFARLEATMEVLAA